MGQTPQKAAIAALLVPGGTQAMADLHGTAVLYSTVSYNEKGTRTFDGTIYFEFQ